MHDRPNQERYLTPAYFWYNENLMLTVSHQHQLVEKTFTDRSGRQFRMVFLVAVVDGELKGRLVSVSEVRPRGSLSGGPTSETILCLPISISRNEVVTEYIPAYAPIVSPFNELYFFVSQPTRAPSHK